MVGPLLFQRYKMNEIVNKILLVEDKFMPEMHLRKPGFTKNKDRMQKIQRNGRFKIYLSKRTR